MVDNQKYQSVASDNEVLFSIDDDDLLKDEIQGQAQGRPGYSSDFALGGSSADNPPLTKDNLHNNQGTSHRDEGTARGLFFELAQYYQIPSEHLYDKLKSILKFHKVKDLELGENSSIELYSTVWIIFTVVIALFVTLCSKIIIVELITGTEASDEKTSNYELLFGVFVTFILYVGIVPLLLKLVIVYGMNEVINGMELLQWYGLSNVVWIPISVLGLLSNFITASFWSNLVEWLLVTTGSAYGLAILYYQLKDDLEKQSKRNVIAAIALLAHIVFTLVLKYMIF